MANEQRSTPHLLDPDPFVLDLLAQAAAAGIGGVLVKMAQTVFDATRSRIVETHYPAVQQQRQALVRIGLQLTKLEECANRAMRIVSPTSRRELGGQLILDQKSLREYDLVRDEAVSIIRDIDECGRMLYGNGDSVSRESVAALPREFREQVRFVQKRLREAATASLAEQSWLQIRAAIVGLRRMHERISQELDMSNHR